MISSLLLWIHMHKNIKIYYNKFNAFAHTPYSTIIVAITNTVSSKSLPVQLLKQLKTKVVWSYQESERLRWIKYDSKFQILVTETPHTNSSSIWYTGSIIVVLVFSNLQIFVESSFSFKDWYCRVALLKFFVCFVAGGFFCVFSVFLFWVWFFFLVGGGGRWGQRGREPVVTVRFVRLLILVHNHPVQLGSTQEI